ncbi:MAG: beta-1,6-N-acetylglucosaminyltransferase [Lachnospiraceae bacterium]|jgi:hypothetical protein|nr:beta-1,6-N-acetylglucosaminyltransferase [Lachnospiraceae bacterium]
MKNRHAILIIAHNNFEILKRNLELMDSYDIDFYIHIDKKIKYKNFLELSNCVKKSGIKIFSCYEVYWGDISLVKTTLFLLEKASNNQEYLYYHLLSSSDMIIKPIDEILKFFNSNYNKEFVHFEDNKLPKIKVDWVKYYYFFTKFVKKYKFILIFQKIILIAQKILKINRSNRTKLDFASGSEWFSITDKLVKYVLKNKDMILKMFNNTICSDEMFLQTLILNSEFKDYLYNNKFNNDYLSCMRMIDWNRGKPYVYKEEDFKDLIDSPYMFARKFDERIDMNIVNKVYLKLLNEKEA